MTRPRFAMLLLLLTLFWPAGVRAADFVIVVHRDNPVAVLETSEIKKIFLGTKNFWPDGKAINVYMLEDCETHELFARSALDKSPRQLEMYWKRALFSGTGIPPRKYPSAEALKAALAADPCAIAYIDAHDLDNRIKAVHLE